MDRANILGLPYINRSLYRSTIQRQSSGSAGPVEYRGSFQPFSRADSGQGAEGGEATSSIPTATQHLPLSAPTNVNEWEFHHKYGIIHGWLCTICQDYISHLGDFYNHPRHQKSPNGSKGLYEAFYRDGLREGITFGKAHADSLQAELLRVEGERRVASEKLLSQQMECIGLREKVKSLQKELEDLQPTPTPTVVPPKGPTDPQVISQAAPRGPFSLATAGARNLHRPSLSLDMSVLRPRPQAHAPMIQWKSGTNTIPPTENLGLAGSGAIFAIRPILSDLRADRAIARLRPDIVLRPVEVAIQNNPDPNGFPAPSPRNQFKNMIVELFSQPGFYSKLLVQMNLSVSAVTVYERYTGSFPMKMEELVEFLAKSGITPQMVSSDFEPWAKNYREGVNESIPFTPCPVQSRARRR
ncbi:hypothetical protein FA13DRAFT_1789167 [Coprinellus micaceus]|uniref:Uncharacterized protein n=1 Tax=Coprinellus micaceus TaxID=71717 RepID=A0A4Y7TKS0_COPMI|nr:hypothetical protein FA13DRAFT_1789167 [Coprinellus micaceus]